MSYPQDSDMIGSIMLPNKNDVWIDDKMALNCTACNKQFSYLLRKHHCRNCGNIFCYRCTSKQIVLHKNNDKNNDKDNDKNIDYRINDIEEKVCDNCYNMVTHKFLIQEQIKAMFDDPKSIIEVKNPNYDYFYLREYYFNELRNIQYYLPDHEYTDLDKALLKVNSKFFTYHSKYLVHLIKSTEFVNNKIYDEDDFIVIDTEKYLYNNSTQMIIDILHNTSGLSSQISCNSLYCTRTCKNKMNFSDCINILYSTYNYLPSEILEYIFDILNEYDVTIIKCYLVFFVNIITKTNNGKIFELVYKLLKKSDILLNSFYWLMNSTKSPSKSETKNINNFIKIFEKNELMEIYQNYMFFHELIKNILDVKSYLKTNFDKNHKLFLPFKPELKIVDIDYDKIVVKDSYTKPVIIPFIMNNGETKRILFKGQNVNNDVVVLNLIDLMNNILRENINKDYEAVTYTVLPITNMSGMIEIVENAVTIYNILSNKQSITQHIMKNNEDDNIGKVLNRYLHSLVLYTLHSYFLGLGDRHLENIMITTDGRIFHIDFGFILGKDSHAMSSEIKINSGMLDVIFGTNSDRYKKYISLCLEAVVLIRKYFQDYYILLSQIEIDNNLKNFINNRFQIKQTDEKIKEELTILIEKSHNVYMESVRDFFHYHTQEKTVQNSFSTILNAVNGLFNSLNGS